MKPLKIGITGVRGVVGEAFTPELAVGFAQAFGTYLDGGRIIVCRDTRPSGPMVRAAVCSGLLAAGCEVIDLGICPTTSMQLATKQFHAEGGIAITAGHNPSKWNALKFVRSDGLYLNATQAEELLDIFHQGEFLKTTWDKIKTSIETADAIGPHIETLKSAFDVETIRSRKLTVAVDCCNGSCALLIPRWLEVLGCNVLAVNDDITAPFPHLPEPMPRTMAQLRAVVKAGHADIGFAHDADGERLGIVTEKGDPLSEELTLPIAALIRLEQRIGPIVTNISTASRVDRVAQHYGAFVIRVPVGQAFISEAMVEHEAVLGGEGSGGVAIPEVHPTHDSAAAIGLILERLSGADQSISQLAEQLPRVTMLKYNVEVEPNRLYSVLQKFRMFVESENLEHELTDGVKVLFDDGWVHVRASNTESIIRVIAEAEEPHRTEDLIAWARDRLQK
jgi:phosphomannomutase